MSISKEGLLTGTVVGVPVGNYVTNDGIINVLQLEQLVFLSMTYGAWFKIVMFLTLLIAIILNLKKVYEQVISPTFKVMKKGFVSLFTNKYSNKK